MVGSSLKPRSRASSAGGKRGDGIVIDVYDLCMHLILGSRMPLKDFKYGNNIIGVLF